MTLYKEPTGGLIETLLSDMSQNNGHFYQKTEYKNDGNLKITCDSLQNNDHLVFQVQ